MGFLTVLFFIFLVLKLMGEVDWSWWVVFAPLIIDISIGVFITLVFGGLAVFGFAKTTKRSKKHRDTRNYF